MRRRAFARRAVRRFMPGEDVRAALAAGEAVAQRGIGALLTQLGENVTSATEAAGVAAHYREVLGEIERRKMRAEVSVKLTQLGLDFDREACAASATRLAQQAAMRGSRLWIDMEDSCYTDVTLDIFRQVHGASPNVGLCLQTYLYRTADDLNALLPLNPWIRLVKGAYNEPPDVAYPRKRDVDANYLTLATRLIEHATHGGNPPVFGTHDLSLIDRLQHRAREHGLDRSACEIHMLFGIRATHQERLAREGFEVCVLISYGSAWFPWYMRRLAERPANVWFVAKSFFG